MFSLAEYYTGQFLHWTCPLGISSHCAWNMLGEFSAPHSTPRAGSGCWRQKLQTSCPRIFRVKPDLHTTWKHSVTQVSGKGWESKSVASSVRVPPGPPGPEPSSPFPCATGVRVYPASEWGPFLRPTQRQGSLESRPAWPGPSQPLQLNPPRGSRKHSCMLSNGEQSSLWLTCLEMSPNEPCSRESQQLQGASLQFLASVHLPKLQNCHINGGDLCWTCICSRKGKKLGCCCFSTI